MEQNEEMIVMKNDLAIAVKKDGTFIINTPDVDTYVALYEGIANYLKTADDMLIVKYLLGDLLGRTKINAVVEVKQKEMEARKNGQL